MREELDGLILLSDEAVQVLENQVAREITASAEQPTSAPLTDGPASGERDAWRYDAP